jgi:hypothetical protein
MCPHQKNVVVHGLICFAVSLVFATSAAAQTPLVQWTFDETAGGTVNAADTGAAPATDGIFGASATRTSDTPGGQAGFSVDLSATGASSIVDGGDSAEVDGLSQFTLSTWAKVTGATHYNEGGSVNVRLLSKQTGGVFDGFSWNLNAPAIPPGSNNNFRMGLFVGGANGFNFAFLDTDIVDRGGEWLFLAVTYDGTAGADNTRFYLGDENNPVAQIGSTVSIPSGQVNPAAARFGIGFTDAAAAADTALTGYQDDTRVYGSALDLATLEQVRLENLPDQGLAGDFNGDGKVDAADYVVWRRGLGTTHTLEQYDDWRGNFGEMLPGGGSAIGRVPEPSVFVLLATGLAGLAVGGRKVWR